MCKNRRAKSQTMERARSEEQRRETTRGRSLICANDCRDELFCDSCAHGQCLVWLHRTRRRWFDDSGKMYLRGTRASRAIPRARHMSVSGWLARRQARWSFMEGVMLVFAILASPICVVCDAFRCSLLLPPEYGLIRSGLRKFNMSCSRLPVPRVMH